MKISELRSGDVLIDNAKERFVVYRGPYPSDKDIHVVKKFTPGTIGSIDVVSTDNLIESFSFLSRPDKLAR